MFSAQAENGVSSFDSKTIDVFWSTARNHPHHGLYLHQSSLTLADIQNKGS